MFRDTVNFRLSNLTSTGRMASLTIIFAALIVPTAVAMRYISLNQALFIALGFAYATVHKHLPNRLVMSIAFALAFFFVPVPSRFLLGVDIVPMISLVLILSTLKREDGPDEVSKPIESRLSNFYIVSALLFASVAALSSMFSYRGPDFATWVIFPIASALVVKRLQVSTRPKFKDLMEFWVLGVSTLLLVDMFGLATSRYRSTDLFNLGRFTGSLGDYELSAEIYGITILVAMYVLLVTESKRLRLLALAEVTGFVALLLATQTRSSFLLTLIGATILVLTSATSKLVKRSLGTLVLVGFSAEIVLLAGGSVQDIWNRLASTEFNQDISGVANRAGVWNYFQNLNSYVNLPPAGNGFSFPYSEIQSYPHSFYLWMLWSGGFLSLLLLVVLGLVSFGKSLSKWKEFRVDAAASIVLLSFVFIDQAKVEVARFASTSWIFWLTLALPFATFRSNSSNSEIEEENR